MKRFASQYGGVEVMKYEDIPVPEPGAGEARVKIEAIGLNYIDVYQRTGLYQLKLPFTLGMEAAGVVDAVGGNVTEVKVGDRVAYSMISGPMRNIRRPLFQAGSGSQEHRQPFRRGDDASGQDGALSDAQHLPAQERRHGARSRCGRRRRPVARSNRQTSRRDGLRHRLDGREGAARPRSRR